jgi:hypothetical protein
MFHARVSSRYPRAYGSALYAGNWLFRALVLVSLPLGALPTPSHGQISLESLQRIRAAVSSPELRAQIAAADTLPYYTFRGIQKEIEKAQAGEITVKLGLDSDESHSSALHDINLGIEMTRGAFPKELRLEARISQTKSDGDTKRDNNFLAKYDYNFSQSVEAYVFAEGKSDTYMSIQSRTEFGAGMRFQKLLFGEVHVRDETPRSEQLHSLHPVVRGRPGVPKKVDDLASTARVEDTRLRLGIAFSTFFELEEAAIATSVVLADSNGAPTPPQKTILSLPSEDRWRFVVRPSAVVRPSRLVTISGYVYFKLPLGAQQNVEVLDNGKISRKYDWRLDADATIRYSLKENDNIAVALSYRGHFDNAPPFLKTVPSSVIAMSNRAADEYHQSVSISLETTW